MTKYLLSIFRVGFLVFIVMAVFLRSAQRRVAVEATVPELSLMAPPQSRTVQLLVDDFVPQPDQGNDVYFYNRMDGDRGSLNDTLMDWGKGYIKMTIAPSATWGGMWLSLNHPIREGLPVNFYAVLPQPIKSGYQTRIKSLHIQITDATPNSILKVELKNIGEVMWTEQTTLTGTNQAVDFDLPILGNINHLVLVLDQAKASDFITVSRISFTAESEISVTATAGFVWSYGMLLQNWNPQTGLVRDKAKDASGEFDAIQSTGSLAAATAVAAQLGVVEHADAIRIVNKINDTLLNKIPRYHGLLPHWVKTTGTDTYVILENTEWSSVDTVIAALGLLEAQSSLGLDTSGTENLLKSIDWDALVTPNGISHGYAYDGTLILFAWDVFGGESWLVQLAYASAKGYVAPLVYPAPPTANGSGFIDELAWLYVPQPNGKDVWGTNWTVYRNNAAKNQIDYYSTKFPPVCFARLGLFGLSAGEVPAPWMVPLSNIYQAFGVGSAFASINDGSQFGAPVVTPHYAAMIVSLRPKESIQMWSWLIDNGYFTPLNNLESLMFKSGANCTSTSTEYNQLKSSWNLSLQAMGWGRYLSEQRGGKYPLWQATQQNPFLENGYGILTGKHNVKTH